MQLGLLQGRNFSRFSSFSLEPCAGLNVFVGANASGKTQVLKLLYAFGPALEKRGSCSAQELADSLQHVFAIGSPEGLLHYGKQQFALQLEVGGLALDFSYDRVQGAVLDCKGSAKLDGELLFVPAGEVLGQLELLQLAMTQAPHSVSLASLELARKLLRPARHRSELGRGMGRLYNYLSQENGGELQNMDGRIGFLDVRQGAMELNLLSAGQRKLAALGLLMANGSLRPGGVLFWDEPEAHLNPKSLVLVASLLLQLGSLGVQVFITTHSLFLLKQLYLGQQAVHGACESGNLGLKAPPACCYFSFAEQAKASISRAACWADLPQVLALDAELAQSEEFNNLFKL